jgi:serine/threonine protein phosphatase 1
MAAFGKIVATSGTAASDFIPRAPAGEVVYAIGDVHGRADLLRQLLGLIEADQATSGKPMRLVTLGDYIDRGPASREVIDILIALSAQGGERMIALKGNHEDALLNFLDDPAAGAPWTMQGGSETLRAYRVDTPREGQGPHAWIAARDAFARAMPPAHLELLRRLKLSATAGDYVFVHAGLRPGVALAQQDAHDLLWIRRAFLDAPAWSERHVVVHGHTPAREPSRGPGRIGIDTGAYATGVLTALRLEEDRQDFIQTTG